MGEWAVALIAAGSALAGSAATGWFTLRAGVHQAGATRDAAIRQAEATLDVMRVTLDDQRAARLQDLRQQTYAQFLRAAEETALALRAGGRADSRTELRRTLDLVLLAGPPGAAQAATRLNAALLDRSQSPDHIEKARSAFLAAAQAALAASADTWCRR